MGWRLVCQQINHACSQLPGGTYCLFLMHPKHECVRNPLSSNPSVWSVSVQPDLDCMDTRDSVMCLQMLLTPSLWLLGGLGEHWAWFGQTNLIALIMPQLSPLPILLKMPATSDASCFLNPDWARSLERYKRTSQSKIPNVELLPHILNHVLC